MMLVPSNAVRLFARTSILVVATGLFHGILLLPIIIRSFTFGIKNVDKINKNQIFPSNLFVETMQNNDENISCDSNEMCKIKQITKWN